MSTWESNALPFTGWECPQCGYFVADEAKRDAHTCTSAGLVVEGFAEVIPFTREDAIQRFLNRWCHRALGDRAMAEKELRELIGSHYFAATGSSA